MKTKLVLSTGALIVAVGSVVWARPVRHWTPEELYEKAEIVVVALITEIEDTGTPSTIQLGSNQPHAIRIRRARLDVMHTIKGKAPEQIVLWYEPLDQEKLKMTLNRPVRIFLEEAKAYLMYLKKKPDKDYFVGILDGSFDDGFAVKSLEPPRSGNPRSPAAE